MSKASFAVRIGFSCGLASHVIAIVVRHVCKGSYMIAVTSGNALNIDNLL